MSDLDYVGARPCGCFSAWMSAEHSTQSEVRKFYADMAKTGREVRRISLEEARPGLARRCAECESRVAA